MSDHKPDDQDWGNDVRRDERDDDRDHGRGYDHGDDHCDDHGDNHDHGQTAAKVTAVTALSADTGASHSDFITSQALQTVSGTFSGTLKAGESIQVSADGGAHWINASISGSSWSASGVTLISGAGSLITRTVDSQGHELLAGASHAYVLDLPPVAPPSLLASFNDTGASAIRRHHQREQGHAVRNGRGRRDGQGLRRRNADCHGDGRSTRNWTQSVKGLADGTHAFTAVQTDIAGNTSAHSLASTMIVDTTVAAPTLVAQFVDSGVSASDGITNATSAMLSGTAEAGATVKVYDGSKLIGTVNANSGSGAWSFDATGLQDGTHKFSAQQTDLAGNSSKSSDTSAMTVDTTPPSSAPTLVASFVDTGSSNTDRITSATTAELSGKTDKGALVQIYDGSTLIATVTADNKGAWSYTAANLPDGTHSFTAAQSDLAGNAGPSSAASTMTVDTVAPGETISTIIGTDAGATATIASGGLTKDNTLALSGTVSDANGVSSVRVYDGAALLGTATVSGGHWNFTTGALGDGTHSFTARATDSAGNTITTVAVSATIDTSVAAPALIATFLDSGIGHTDGITNATKATLSGTAEHGAAVVVYDGTAPLATVTADPVTGAWSYVATGLTNGAHSFTAVATDIAGNLSARSAASNMTVDTIAPAAPVLVAAFLDSGLSGDHITNANAAILSGTAERGATVVVYDGTAPLATVTADPVLGLWSYAATGLSDGTHNFTATATDIAGNVSVLSTASPMTVDTVATAPGVALASDTGVAGDNIASNDALKGSAEAGATVKAYEGTTLLGTVTADGGGHWALTPLANGAPLTDGAHNLTVTATDIAGNSAQSAFSFTLDTTTAAPAVSLVADTGVAGDNITSNAALTGSAEAGATVKAYEGSTLLGTAVADSGGTWALTPAGLADGVHNLTVTATDIAGNSAQSAFSFTLDTTIGAPTVALQHDTSAGADNADHITRLDALAGTAETGATVTVSEGSNQLGAAVADSSGNWIFTPDSLSDGAYTLTVTATDVAGKSRLQHRLHSLLIPIRYDAVIADATNDAGTTFAYGTAEAGSAVRVLDPSKSAQLGTTTADSSGAWSLILQRFSREHRGLLDIAGNPSGLRPLTPLAGRLFDRAANVSASVAAASYTLTPRQTASLRQPATGK